MAFDLSFSEDFFGDPMTPSQSDSPTNVVDALASIADESWDTMARDLFGVDGDQLQLETVLEKIRETNTCSNLTSPVEVWIDPEGYYKVRVYDSGDAENDT